MEKKKLKKIKLSDYEILTTNQMSSITGGGWTTNYSTTYVGAEGDCYESCDSYGTDKCKEDDYTLVWSWCNEGSGDSGYYN